MAWGGWQRKTLPNASINVLGKVQQDVIASNIFTEDWFPSHDPTDRAAASCGQSARVTAEEF